MRLLWRRFDLPERQFHRGSASIDLDVHADDLVAYSAHFAQEPGHRTRDYPDDLTSANLIFFHASVVQYSAGYGIPHIAKRFASAT